MDQTNPTTFEHVNTPTALQQRAFKRLKESFEHIEIVVNALVRTSRYRSLALTALEEAAMWANKAVSRGEVLEVPEDTPGFDNAAVAAKMDALGELYVARPVQLRAFRVKTPTPVVTTHGPMVARPGDFVVEGHGGTYYPCPADAFEYTHELAGK